MTTRTCPVCGHQQDREKSECTCCGWDFSPLLGTPEQVEALLKDRLDRARTDWRQRRYNPELVPKLEKDSFETRAEFASRVAERPWYVGEGALWKAQYDIETGRFPLELIKIQDWVKSVLGHQNYMYLRLSRDEASKLYAESADLPVYARLVVRRGQVKIQSMEILKSGNTLPVFSENLPEPHQVIKKRLGHTLLWLWLIFFLVITKLGPVGGAIRIVMISVLLLLLFGLLLWFGLGLFDTRAGIRLHQWLRVWQHRHDLRN